MTGEEKDDLKTYLEGKFNAIDARFTGIDQRLDGMDQRFEGIEKHLDRQDADLEHRTLSILQLIDESTKESRLWASRLFVLLDQERVRRDGR